MSSIVYAFVGGLLLGIATVGYLYINGRSVHDKNR